jgi:outer membrane lipoprotein carrier protein
MNVSNIHIKRFSTLLFLLLFSTLSNAVEKSPDSNKAVYQYFSTLDSFHANFTQTVKDSDGEDIQQSEGEVWIQRPGKFRWNYLSPYKQEVVANGVELWTYDPELEQATVKPIDQVLSVTPAMLLSGARKLHEIATIHSKGVYQGQNWYQVLPLEIDETVDQVQLAFVDKQLFAIRVNDSFGNTTTIKFSNQKKNKMLPGNLFSIELPAGTDILGAD